MTSLKISRRTFTKNLFGGSAAIVFSPSLVLGNDKESMAPWAAAFKGVTQDLPAIDMTVEGTIPAACYGSLYRNGPALFERDGQRYSHWFDPDGMIQSFKLSAKGISHFGRFVRT